MLTLLAQLDPESAAAQWFWWVSLIMVIGAVAVLVVVVVGVGRRWKRRQLNAIDEDRESRRAGRSSGRVDAWAASSDRYVDHDKLPDEPQGFDHDSEGDDDDEPIHGSAAGEPDPMQEPDDEDRDPFGLFSDKPYQDPDDEDDDAFDEDEDDDGDWDEEDDRL